MTIPTELMGDEASPTARALVALELIHDRPGVSGERLGERLGVSARAARRYVGILREAGIPVESTPGRHGGYRVGRGFRVPPLMFSTTEALALVMAAVKGHVPTGGDAPDPVEHALDKILRVLPASLAGPAEALRVVVTGTGSAPPGPDPALTGALALACTAGRRVRLAYRTSPQSERRDLDVDPWGVVVRHDRWYLLCWSHGAGERRVLRVDRVERVTELDDAFEPPADLDAAAEVERHLAEGWELPVEIVVGAPLERVARCVPRQLGRLEADGPDRTRIVGSTGNPDYYVRRLAGTELAAPIEVVGPPEVREAFARLAAWASGGAGQGSAGEAAEVEAHR